MALLLAGEIRTLDYCLQRQLDKISSTDRVHVFLSTWDSSMPSVRQNFRSWNPSIIRTGKQQELEFITPEDIKARFPRIDSISVLSQSATHELHDSLSKGTGPSDEAPEQVNAGVYVTLNQLLLLGNAITMMQAQEDLQSARFDYVIRSRPDIVFKRKILWPCEDELILDCLKPTRRSYGGLFDGFFVCSRNHLEKIGLLYDDYAAIAAHKALRRTFDYAYAVKYGFLEVLYQKSVSDSFMTNEDYVRSTYAHLSDLQLVDARIGVKLVR